LLSKSFTLLVVVSDFWNEAVICIFLHKFPIERADCGQCLPVQEYLEENDEVTFDIFLEKIWDNIREIYRRPQDETKETETVTTEMPDVRLVSVNYLWIISL